MILHLYFARRFVTIFAFLSLIIWALIMLIDLVEQTRKFSRFDLSFSEISTLSFFNTPQTLNELLPLILILSTVVLFLGLARSSEMVVTRAAGRSALRSLVSILFVSLLIGALAISVLNPLVAATTKQYQNLSNAYFNPGSSTISIGKHGLWLRQGDETGQTVIHASRANTDGSVLFDTRFFTFPNTFENESTSAEAQDGNTGTPKQRVDAQKAHLEEGKWVLHNAKKWQFIEGKNPESLSYTHERLELSTPLTLEDIQEHLGDPTHISIWALPAFIHQLQQAGFSTRRHEVSLQSELARPLFLMAMVMIGAVFTMRHTRSGGIGLSVLMAVMLGFGMYFIRNFAQILGENGQIPIYMAAWAPPLAAILLALGILLHKEDG